MREALGSVFQNIYAEGYPDEETRWMSEDEILDYTERLAHFRRYSDPRYYKGVEYADMVEALARRRCAEAFAQTASLPISYSSMSSRFPARPPITPSTPPWSTRAIPSWA